MTPAEELTGRCGGRWHQSYGEARCPAHDDRAPSLTIRNGDRAPLVKCHTGCDSRQIINALRQAGHWPDVHVAVPRQSQAHKRSRSDEEANRYRLSIWREARPISGTPAETYLRERGIRGELPLTLRYHPGIKHTDTGLMLPAMVAAVQAPDRTICAIHRTYLRADGAGKAPVTKPRKVLGRYMGGAIRL